MLTINGIGFTVRPIPSQDETITRAFRLRRKGIVIDVAQTSYGPTCDCPDFIFRREHRDPKGCLHIRAMRAVGLLDKG